MADEDIIALAKQNNQVLITEDKYFGEWILSTIAQTVQAKHGDTVACNVFDNVQEAEEWIL